MEALAEMMAAVVANVCLAFGLVESENNMKKTCIRGQGGWKRSSLRSRWQIRASYTQKEWRATSAAPLID